VVEHLNTGVPQIPTKNTKQTPARKTAGQISKTLAKDLKVKAKTDQPKKASNEGDVAEGVLGAALVAKLIARQTSGKIGKVTSADVLKVLNTMRRQPISPKGSSKGQLKMDMGGHATDKITFKLNLGMKMMTELKEMKDLSILTRLAAGAASYANSPRFDGLAEAMYNNNINNKLEIDVDGISDNRGTKADVVVRTDKYAFDKISLKAGSMKTGHSLGQVGGNTWAAILRVFGEGFNEKTRKHEVGLLLPINTKANEDAYMKKVTEKPTFGTVEVAVRWAYDVACKALNTANSSQIATNLAQFLDHHLSRGDNSIKVVKFHLGSHKTFDVLRLPEMMKGKKMKAIVRMETKWPIMLIYDESVTKHPTTKYSPGVLIAIRPKMDTRIDGYITHLIEEGPQLGELIEDKSS
jgi:hypothetical protein